ncbi:MAG: hypothetical protein IKH78_00205 [Ruminococcus sp.]|nr:hypothetical protein [Ruminococcus sp.]
MKTLRYSYRGGAWMVVNPGTDNDNEVREFILPIASDEAQMPSYVKVKPEYVNNTKAMDDLIAGNPVFNEKISGKFKEGQNYFAALEKCALEKGEVTGSLSSGRQEMLESIVNNVLFSL